MTTTILDTDLAISFKGNNASRLRKIAKKHNISVIDFVEKAILMGDTFLDEMDNGNRVVIADSNGRPLKELKK